MRGNVASWLCTGLAKRAESHTRMAPHRNEGAHKPLHFYTKWLLVPARTHTSPFMCEEREQKSKENPLSHLLLISNLNAQDGVPSDALGK